MVFVNNITYLEITMYHISRVQIFYGFEQLIHNILLVDVLQYIASFYHIVQVSVYNFVHDAILYIINANHNIAQLYHIRTATLGW